MGNVPVLHHVMEGEHIMTNTFTILGTEKFETPDGGIIHPNVLRDSRTRVMADAVVFGHTDIRGSIIGPDNVVHEYVSLVRCISGRDCEFRTGSQAFDSTFGDSVVVWQDAYMRLAWLLDEVDIGPRAQVIESLIGHHASLANDTSANAAYVGAYARLEQLVNVSGGAFIEDAGFVPAETHIPLYARVPYDHYLDDMTAERQQTLPVARQAAEILQQGKEPLADLHRAALVA